MTVNRSLVFDDFGGFQARGIPLIEKAYEIFCIGNPPDFTPDLRILCRKSSALLDFSDFS